MAQAAAAPLFIGAMAGGSLLSAAGQFAEGSIKRQESKVQADNIGLQAKQKELARTKSLNEAIASQIASASGRGIELTGSPMETIEVDVEEARRAQEAEDTATRINQMAVRSAGRQAMRRGRLGAMTSLLQGGSSMAMPFV